MWGEEDRRIEKRWKERKEESGVSDELKERKITFGTVHRIAKLI